MRSGNVLLVLVGALGDLAWRKFIGAARAFERENDGVAVMLIDVPWEVAGAVPLADELRWRIGRRCIELRAEEINDDKVSGISLGSDLAQTSLPWCVGEFVSRHLRGDADAIERERRRLQDSLEDWVQYFMETSPRSDMRRYTHDLDSVRESAERLKARGWKVAVFVATPPQAYPAIVDQWRAMADRLVLEKPAGGLDPRTLSYGGTHGLREAAGRARGQMDIATNDHYNAKLITRVMDRVSDYGIFNSLLDPARIRRIVVQLTEQSPLPMGRYGFYNGAGGAFGDMAPHLLQAVRAILGIPGGELDVRFESFYWARYVGTPAAAPPPTESPYIYEPSYYQALREETETFVAFKALVALGGRLIPLYCRTGKGLPPRKSLRVDTQYGEKESDVLRLIFDFGNDSLTIRDDYKKFIMTTGKIDLSEPFQSGVPAVDTAMKVSEYKGIFDALVQSDWSPDALDRRYFPSVSQAADLSDMIYSRLVEERDNSARIVYKYIVDKPSTYLEVLELMQDEAEWE